MQTEINKWDLIKLKSFCTEKDTINKMNEKTTIVTKKGLISKVYKHFKELYIKNNLIKKEAKDLNRHFFK